jgi:RNA polymerase sigma-70 factor (ECF subfamily)
MQAGIMQVTDAKQRSKGDQVNSEPHTTARLETDLDLVKRAQEGDTDAFASLFYSHKARIYSVCLRMTNNTAEAEDLTQDAFLQVFRKLGSFRGDSALSTWLYRIAVNTVLMHFRKKALKQVSLDEPCSQDAKLVRREYGSKDDRLTGSVDRIALARAIKELPYGYRTIFLLHEVEGYEHQEIAQLLDCSVGNSKSQLHKAKLRIRELLGHAKAETNEMVPAQLQPRIGKPSTSRTPINWNDSIGNLPVQPAMIPAVSHLVATNA